LGASVTGGPERGTYNLLVVSFRCDPAALERLEWGALAEGLAALASTARGAQACRAARFASSPEHAAALLAQTSEARALVDAGAEPPFGGVADVRALLLEVGRGRVLGARELKQLLDTLEAAGRLRAFFEARSASQAASRTPEGAARLGAVARELPDLAPLGQVLTRLLTPEGELRDDASPALARARKAVRRLSADIERLMARLLRDPDIQPHLQDAFVTTREGRPVLPVRAADRARVRGIVHDVSASGTTVFIEPELAIDLGNQLRLAQTEAEREVERVLREASARVAAHADPLEQMGDRLEEIDAAFARGRLSLRLDACAPALCAEPTLELRQLRHPLLLLEAGLSADQVVPNDIALPAGARCLVISGPNAGGKTVAAKAVGLAALALRAGLHVPCAEGSRISLPDAVFAELGDEQDLRAGLSTFSARLRNLKQILEAVDGRSLVIADEVGDGTEPGEGAALAQAMLEALVARGALVIATTHFNRLKELAGADARFANASAEFDPRTLAPTYRVHLGAPGSSGALYAARRMGVETAVIERAEQLLDGEDRKLEALTRSLSELRQQLEVERQSAQLTRERSEAARAAYEARLETLRRGREAALQAMNADLESAFAAARGEIAAVMRSVQAGSDEPPRGREAGRAANRARARLDQLRERTRELARPLAAAPAAPTAVTASLLERGARVQLSGVGGEAVVLEPPDPRGRVGVRVGSVRSVVPLERIARVLGPAPATAPRAHVDVERAPSEAAARSRCDLRGLRVDEALDRADAHLQAHLGRGPASLLFVHGHGTGALRDAIRSWLRAARGVSAIRAGEPGEGGNGVTIAELEG
jgi:DNA mismatch repair protein MutS2